MQVIKNIIFRIPIFKIHFDFLWIINEILKSIFLPKTIKHYNSLNRPYWVIINDNLLKFHNWDIRKQIKKELDL